MSRRAILLGAALGAMFLMPAAECLAQIMGSDRLPSERLGAGFFGGVSSASQFTRGAGGEGGQPLGPLAAAFTTAPERIGGGFGPAQFDFSKVKVDLKGLRLRTLESFSLAKRARFADLQRASLEIAGLVGTDKTISRTDVRKAFYQFIFPFGLRDKPAEYGYGYYSVGCLYRGLIKDPDAYLAEFGEEAQSSLSDEKFIKAVASLIKDKQVPEGESLEQYYDTQLAAMGNYLFNNRRYAQAADVWQVLAKRDPQSALYAQAAGQSLFAGRRLEAAAGELRRSIALALAARAAVPAAPEKAGAPASAENQTKATSEAAPAEVKVEPAPAAPTAAASKVELRIQGANLQNIYADAGDLAEARLLLEGLLEKEPGNEKLEFLMAYIDLFHGLWDRAEKRLTVLAAGGDKEATALLEALKGGRVAQSIHRPFAEDEKITAGDVAEMSTDVLMTSAERKAIAEAILNPKTFKDYMSRGDYYFFMGNYARGAVAFETAARLEPRNFIPKFAAVHAAFANGEFQYAARMLREALQVEPNWGLFNFRLEEFYGDRKDMDRRVADLDHLVQLRGELKDLKLLLAYVYYFDGRYGEAAGLLAELSTLPDYQVAENLLRLARLQT